MLYSINLRRLKPIFRQGDRTIAPQEQERLRNSSHQRYRTDILFVFTIFTLTFTLYFCWGIVNNPESNPENVKSAFALILAIVSGLVGFVTGKAVG
ncbi:MAG: hypothetical protein AAGE84_00255 [Cyanobacteria bacterium P01_G01_bin.39]